MQRIVSSLFVVVALAAGCDGAASFKAAIPTRDQVAMRVPSSSGQALTVGERASFYESTVDIATSVNGGVLGVFDVIDAILAQPPTTLEENVAVWGPSEPRGLERLSFQFTVTRNDDGTHHYALEARPKDGDADFTEIFAGDAEAEGVGTLTYHLGSLRELDDRDACLTGDIDVAYDATVEPRTLDVVFHAVADECAGERATDAHYAYLENADASGQMDFAFVKNLHGDDEDKPGEETMSVRSRWLASGEGRADVRVSGGEIPADLAASIPGTTATTVDVVECWDASFGLVYGDTTPDEVEPHLGHEATGDASLCAFADASFASL